MLIRLLLIEYLILVFPVVKALHLIVVLTTFNTPELVVGLKEVSVIFSNVHTLFTFIVLTILYRKGSSVIYEVRQDQ